VEGGAFWKEMAMLTREMTAWSAIFGTLGAVWALIVYFIFIATA
jgi:hypothetical protein